MPSINLILDGDNAWPDLQEKMGDIVHLTEEPWQLAVLENGMRSGKPSLMLRLNVPTDAGDIILLAETSMEVWIAATIGMRARYPEVFRGGPLE